MNRKMLAKSANDNLFKLLGSSGYLLCRWVALCLLLFAASPGFAQDEEEGAPVTVRGASSSYIDLKPPFVANYGGVPTGRLHYLKADISLRVDSGGEMAVMHHMPAIRDKLLMLFSRQSEDVVMTVEGKELLRTQALEEVRNVLLAEEGDQKVTDLLFNSFIIQQ